MIFKGSTDPSRFIFEISVGKGRIRHITTLNLNLQSTLSRSGNLSFNFRFVVCRIRLFPTLISKIKWLESELPLIFYEPYSMEDHMVEFLPEVIVNIEINWMEINKCLIANEKVF